MSGWAEATTIGDLLMRSAEDRPDHEAIVFPHARFTYGEVAERATLAARSLAALGVGRGDHVGLLMPNCPDFVFSFFGIQLLGAVPVPINTRFRARELAFVIDNADLVVLLTSDIVDDQVDFVERLGETFEDLSGSEDPAALALAGAPRLRSVVLLGDREPPGFLSQRAYDAKADEVEDSHVMTERAMVRVRDIGLILFTSGTTANPKGCLLTHEAVVRVWCTAAWKLRITPEDRVWDALPMFHMSCLGPMMFCFNMGATLVSMLHFEPGAALEQIENERATLALLGVPADRDGADSAPRLRRAGPVLGPRAPERRAARHAAPHAGRLPAGGPGGRPLRHDRVRRRDHVQRVGGQRAAPGRDLRPRAARRRGQGRRPRERRSARPAPDRRAPDPRLRPLRGLLPAARRDRRDVRPPTAGSAPATRGGWTRTAA